MTPVKKRRWLFSRPSKESAADAAAEEASVGDEPFDSEPNIEFIPKSLDARLPNQPQVNDPEWDFGTAANNAATKSVKADLPSSHNSSLAKTHGTYFGVDSSELVGLGLVCLIMVFHQFLLRRRVKEMPCAAAVSVGVPEKPVIEPRYKDIDDIIRVTKSYYRDSRLRNPRDVSRLDFCDFSSTNPQPASALPMNPQGERAFPMKGLRGARGGEGATSSGGQHTGAVAAEAPAVHRPAKRSRAHHGLKFRGACGTAASGSPAGFGSRATAGAGACALVPSGSRRPDQLRAARPLLPGTGSGGGGGTVDRATAGRRSHAAEAQQGDPLGEGCAAQGGSFGPLEGAAELERQERIWVSPRHAAGACADLSLLAN